jgi:hypothetical protein
MEIAPTNESEACTAAVCVFGWNPEENPERAFQALVTYKSIESIRKDLNSFIEEARDLAEMGAEDKSAETRKRKEALQKRLKIIVGWSGVTDDAIMAANTAQDIIRKSKHKVFTAGGASLEATYQEEIAAPNVRDFRKILAPFIDSNRQRKPEWALVNIVEIRAKAEVLRHGVKLVDLPGVMDGLEARSTVAASYMWRLDKRIVVVPTSRATDSSTAQDLMLPSADIMDMKLDRQFNRDSLAVAVNSIDNIGIANAEEEFGDLDRSIGGLAGEIESQTQIVSELKDQIKEVEEDVADFQSSGASGDEDREYLLSSAPQLTWSSNANNLNSGGLEALEKKLAGLKQQWQTALHLCNQKTDTLRQKCIAARNQRIAANFAETFTESDHDSTGSPRSRLTNIFPNSAHAYRAIKSGVPSSGFSDLESTGIDALRRWIGEVSLPFREEESKSHLQRLNMLFDAASGWIRHSQDDNDELYRLSGSVGKNTLDALILHHREMEKVSHSQGSQS